MIRQTVLAFVCIGVIARLLLGADGFNALLVHGGRLARPADTRPASETRPTTSKKVALTRRPIKKRPPAGKTAAPLSTLTIHDLDGQTISSASWPGKVTIVNFWATWCPPCRTEIPQLVAIQHAYGSELQIVGISVDHTSAESVRRFTIDHGINYPVAMVTGDLRRRFPRVRALPTSFVLDSKGRIVRTHVGMLTLDVYQRVIRKLTIPSWLIVTVNRHETLQHPSDCTPQSSNACRVRALAADAVLAGARSTGRTWKACRGDRRWWD